MMLERVWLGKSKMMGLHGNSSSRWQVQPQVAPLLQCDDREQCYERISEI